MIRCLGVTSCTNAAFAAAGGKCGEICFAAGGVVAFYSARRDRQTKFCFANAPVSAIAVSNDGKFICVGLKKRAGTLVVFDVSTCASIRCFDSTHGIGVSAIAFSPAGDRIASAGFVGDKRPLVVTWKDSSRPLRVNIFQSK